MVAQCGPAPDEKVKVQDLSSDRNGFESWVVEAPVSTLKREVLKLRFRTGARSEPRNFTLGFWPCFSMQMRKVHIKKKKSPTLPCKITLIAYWTAFDLAASDSAAS